MLGERGNGLRKFLRDMVPPSLTIHSKTILSALPSLGGAAPWTRWGVAATWALTTPLAALLQKVQPPNMALRLPNACQEA